MSPHRLDPNTLLLPYKRKPMGWISMWNVNIAKNEFGADKNKRADIDDRNQS